MRCEVCGQEIAVLNSMDYTCPKCGFGVYKPSNCDIPLPQGFSEQKGWICPVCGRGVAPWVDYCPCQSDWKITYGTSTGGDVDLSEYQDMMDRIQKALEDGEIKL